MASRSLVLVTLLIIAAPALSENDETGAICEDPSPQSTVYQAPPKFEADEQDNTKISANITRSNKNGESEFEGDVIINQHELRIRADQASYFPDNEKFNVNGHVHVDIENMAIDAGSGEITTGEGATEFNDVQFLLPGSGMRGTAETIATKKEENTRLKNASITTCDLVEPDWRLNAETIDIDHIEEYGSADDVVLRFQEIPFLYVPYMEFPIGDRRRSGLLVPEFGDSASRGFELSVPWYWNIAPNQDAILAPHYMNKRGTELGAQYRFLTEHTKGEINGAYLPNDDIINRERYQYEYIQSSKVAEKTNLKINVQDVSDTEYFNDFSSNLSSSSRTHLSRSATLSHKQQHWQAQALVQTYETLDTTILPANRPYKKLPQVSLDGDTPVNDYGLGATLQSEWVNFDHEDASKTTGTRTVIKPGIHWLINGTSWYIDPAISLSHTQYDVESGTGSQIDIKDRNLVISSLDSGLFFERGLDNGLTQTLEPRVYYLHTPYKDQSNLPLFDTNQPTFNIRQLFSDNRFNGSDRIGDANQVTLAISSRIIDPATGDEYMRASIGQITYFEDRLVSLDNIPETTNQSDLIGELGGSIQNWDMRTSLQWDTETSQSARENFMLHYKSDSKHIFNLGYRMDRTKIAEEIKQTDLSFVVPITNTISTFARWNYSLIDNSDIDVIGGLSYESCCWSIQILGQRHLQSTNTVTEYDNAVMVQFVLKGLGSVSGDSVNKTLKQSILGYDEDI